MQETKRENESLEQKVNSYDDEDDNDGNQRNVNSKENENEKRMAPKS